MNGQEALTAYLAAFIDGLEQAGVKDVVISPGSRSTPLALLLAEHPNIEVFVNIDERSAAFFALGLAKATRKPVALLCTSGTAAANYYPAIIEASLSRVPLIVLTADRPHELRDVGAPQAIDQIHLFGKHVRWYTEMAIPEPGATMIRYAKKAGLRAVTECQGLPSGPVHLNFPLREPLIPRLNPSPFSNSEASRQVEIGQLGLSEESYKRIAEEWQGFDKGLIICGPLDKPGFSAAVSKLSEKLGFPILADPLSQLRSGSLPNETIIDSYDAILKSETVCLSLKPEIIIRFGGLPVSKPLSLFMKTLLDIEHVVIDGDRGWRDPEHIGTELFYCDESVFCNRVAANIYEAKESKWLFAWREIDQIAKDAISNQLQKEAGLDEGKAVRELVEMLPENSAVFVGNSMPIRDIDTFFHKNEKNIRIMANRGANGIDGVVSTALGSAVYMRSLFLVIGDLSFFHDMNGLLAAKMYKLNMTIIVLNNDGGGIFSYLPQAEEPKHFELLYGTPTGLNFEYAVRMYDGHYTKVADWKSYQTAISDSLRNEGLNVIEVPTDRAKNTANHRAIWTQVSQEINKYLQGLDI